VSTPARAQSSRLAYASDKEPPPDSWFEVFWAREDGSFELQLSDQDLDDGEPTICPNGRKIVYQGYPSPAPYTFDLYRVDNDGSNVTNLTQTSAFSEREADCGSPLGGSYRIVFAGQPDDDGDPFTGNYHIYRMSITGTGLMQLTDGDYDDREPVWCGPGMIIFSSNRDGNYELYSMDANGDNETRLTTHSAADRHPACNLDATKIAWAHDTGIQAGFEIYTMDVDGDPGSWLPLITGSNTDEIEPTWSPSGTMIAFTIKAVGAGKDGIYKINVDDPGVVFPYKVSGIYHYRSPDWGAGVQ